MLAGCCWPGAAGKGVRFAEGSAGRKVFRWLTAHDVNAPPILSRSIVAVVLQDAVNDSGARGAAFKQSIMESANFLVNIPMVCKARPDVLGVVANEEFDRLSLFTGPQRAGLTRGQIALRRLLKLNAEK